jgi:hypothetical protein
MKIAHQTFDAIKCVNGNMHLINQSGTMELEVTPDEIEDYERRSGVFVESDVVPDWLMGELLLHLRHEEALSDDYEFICSK